MPDALAAPHRGQVDFENVVEITDQMNRAASRKQIPISITGAQTNRTKLNFSYYTRHTSFALALFLVAFAQAQDITNNQTDISVARRLEWIRKGITHIGEQKESSDVSTKREDIRRLISVTGTENLLKQNLSGMIPQMKQAMPQVPDEAWREVEKPASIHEMIELYVSIYEKHFTHEEIKGMLDFYDTPLGKKTVAKMPIVMQESMEAGNKWGRDLSTRVEKMSSSSVRTQTQSTRVALESDQHQNEISRVADDDLGREILIGRGLNPEEWELTPINGSFVGTAPNRKTLPANTKPVALPKDIRYIIKYSSSSGASSTYYSKEEPKPYGNGFKFKMFPTEAEFTLSGNVEIIKIPLNTSGK